VALVRRSAASLAAFASGDSLVEVMLEQMLHSTGHVASSGEIRSWRRSLPVLAADLVDAGLGKVEVLLEHHLPLTSKRVDAILAGRHPRTGEASYVLVELKQWSSADVYEGDPALVRIDAYGDRPVLHPVDQVRGYCDYLVDFIPTLADGPATVTGVAYLHNATEFGIAGLRDLPESDYGRLFTGERRAEFLQFLRDNLDADYEGATYADQLVNAHVAPSRQLLAVAAVEIQQREQFVLLAEQQLAYRTVLHATTQARAADSKQVVVVTGGPGSGKSVIALSLLGELARQGRTVVHATGSRSFTQTLRKVAGRGSTRTQKLFKYFNQFVDAERNGLDVLILDEAHRIRETSVDRYTKAQFRTGRPQIDELIAAARVPVFLLDQHQVVRPGELGTVEEITAYAARLGLPVHTINLDEQFRCGGSESYVLWVNRLLGLADGGPVRWDPEPSFQLQVADSPWELEAALDAAQANGYGARIAAGYCWPWSDPLADGSLVNDVVLGDWSRPWNLRGDRAVGGAPPAALWASDPAGFGQVGCVYTAQGFEYDWNGVILGSDLVWRTDRWVSVRTANKDPDFRNSTKVPAEEFDRLVRNVYKVLLTRGMVATVIYSTDEETRTFLRSIVPIRSG
jgi:hypothetical protein